MLQPATPLSAPRIIFVVIYVQQNTFEIIHAQINFERTQKIVQIDHSGQRKYLRGCVRRRLYNFRLLEYV